MTHSKKLIEMLDASFAEQYERRGLLTAPHTADALIAKGVLITPETGIGDLSDGYHTFNELYHHRAVLFSVICNSRPDIAWKSKLHDTGDMYEGMFIVGIETPQGQATYHYDIEPYWDMFKVKELDRAPKWDGHTPQEAIKRIESLTDTKQIPKRPDFEGDGYDENGYLIYDTWICPCCEERYEVDYEEHKHCPNCGQAIDWGDTE